MNPSLVLTHDFEFHIFELPKFVPSGDNIEELPAEEKWLYLFTHATEMEPETLAEILNEPPYREAIGVLQMISKSEEDLQYYEDRLKFLRDQQSWLEDARQQGRQEALQEGIIGGKIQMLQELLGEPVASNETILASSVAELTAQLDALQQRLRNRDA
jgi:predicted transposase/invertase (TIGR01784 family)